MDLVKPKQVELINSLLIIYRSMNKYALASVVASAVVIADQLSKYLIRNTLPLYSNREILPFLDFTHIRNPGVAFGMLRDLPDEIRMPFFLFVLIAAVFVIIYIIKSTARDEKTVILSLSLILGGAIGNSIDRFRLGYVTDFIDLHWFGNPDYHWPPFNISDSCITIGAILIFVFSIFYKKGE